MSAFAETINMRTDTERKRRLQLAADLFDDFFDALAPAPTPTLIVAADRLGRSVRREG